MIEGKPRISRLTAILTQLQSKRIVTAKNIADKHRVSIRTIYRDIRTLEKSGIPIMTVEGKGYAMMDGYKIPPVMFTQEEANALITAEQIISQNSDVSLIQQYENAVTKIKSVLQDTQQEKTELLSNRIQVRKKDPTQQSSNYLIQLQTTIANYQIVQIKYLSLNNEASERAIEPFALYTTQGNWILIAFCRVKNDFRAFRLDCIQQLNLINKYFEPHEITLQQYLENCSKSY